jgi:nicotinamide mononucleotide transporter
MLNQEALSALLDWAAPLLQPWFTAWSVPVSRLEGVAFVLSLWMVVCNLRVSPWAWPLAILSSLAYGLLFLSFRLYGEAVLQVVFVLLSCWGWWQWLRGREEGALLRVRHLSSRGVKLALWSTAVLWPLLGVLLDRVTDSDVPYGDALPTAGSIVGQVLLGRKWVENWPCWLWVNVVSMGLFAYKQLWLTVILYGLFAALSWVGWQQWRSLAQETHRVNHV